MSQGIPRDRGKERYWRQLLRQWRRSGQSAAAFCREHGVSQPSFYNWRRTITERDAEAPAFVPVRVVDEGPRARRGGDAPSAGLELVLGSGRRLCIGPEFDPATLARLLAMLEEGQA